jgi:hypothetical protein
LWLQRCLCDTIVPCSNLIVVRGHDQRGTYSVVFDFTKIIARAFESSVNFQNMSHLNHTCDFHASPSVEPENLCPWYYASFKYAGSRTVFNAPWFWKDFQNVTSFRKGQSALLAITCSTYRNNFKLTCQLTEKLFETSSVRWNLLGSILLTKFERFFSKKNHEK